MATFTGGLTLFTDLQNKHPDLKHLHHFDLEAFDIACNKTKIASPIILSRIKTYAMRRAKYPAFMAIALSLMKAGLSRNLILPLTHCYLDIVRELKGARNAAL